MLTGKVAEVYSHRDISSQRERRHRWPYSPAFPNRRCFPSEVFATGYIPHLGFSKTGFFHSSFPRPSRFVTGASRADFLLMSYARRDSRRGFYFSSQGQASLVVILARAFLSLGGLRRRFFLAGDFWESGEEAAVFSQKENPA
jgi:hypothetical protein